MVDLLLNFKFLLPLLILVCGCGVKAPPLKHPDTVIESYVRTYTTESEPVVNSDQNKVAPPAPSH